MWWCKLTRNISGQYEFETAPIENINGKLVTAKEEQLKLWKNYFQKTLNFTTSDTTLIQATQEGTSLTNNEDPTSIEELNLANSFLQRW